MHARFVVVGSGYAGTLAALRLAHRAGPGAVTLVDPALVLVERVRLHEALVHGRDVTTFPLASIADRAGVTLVRGRAVDLVDRALVLDDGRRLSFDRCIVATGSRVAQATPGSREHALALEPDTLPHLRSALTRADRVAVLGGGLTGIEIAAEIAEAMPQRRVVLVTKTLAPSLTRPARAHVERALSRLRVERIHAAIDRVERGVVHAQGRTVPFDLAIDTLGFASAAPVFLGGARDAMGRVIADGAMRVRGREDVILAGDLAAPDTTLAGDPMIRGCQSAMPLGAHAADVAWGSAIGEPVHAFRFVPNGFCVSLGREDGVVDAYGRVVTGRAAAWIKERIVRYTTAALAWQARGWDYRWRPFFGAATRALPADTTRALSEAST